MIKSFSHATEIEIIFKLLNLDRLYYFLVTCLDDVDIFTELIYNFLNTVTLISYHIILKVSKSRKQFLELSILPKNERKT